MNKSEGSHRCHSLVMESSSSLCRHVMFGRRSAWRHAAREGQVLKRFMTLRKPQIKLIDGGVKMSINRMDVKKTVVYIYRCLLVCVENIAYTQLLLCNDVSHWVGAKLESALHSNNLLHCLIYFSFLLSASESKICNIHSYVDKDVISIVPY